MGDLGIEARPYAPLPPPDPLVHIIIQQDCKKGLRIWSQSKWKKGIAGRNAIHFGTRNVDWECNPFKKDFTDACWYHKESRNEKKTKWPLDIPHDFRINDLMYIVSIHNPFVYLRLQSSFA